MTDARGKILANDRICFLHSKALLNSCDNRLDFQENLTVVEKKQS